MAARIRPERSCVGCRGRAPKSELLRIVRGVDGGVRVDVSGRAAGRGAYVHREDRCIRAAARGDRLAAALRTGSASAATGSLMRELIEGAGVLG